MARVGFYDREGKAIPQDVWTAKSKDPSYAVVREYDNAVVRVTLKWIGRVQNPGNYFGPEFMPLFVLLVKNYRADGSMVDDPADGDQKFGTEAVALAAYEEFLLKWTKSERDDEGEFVEADNTLTPPPPPDPNKPSTEATDLEGGAW